MKIDFNQVWYLKSINKKSQEYRDFLFAKIYDNRSQLDKLISGLITLIVRDQAEFMIDYIIPMQGTVTGRMAKLMQYYLSIPVINCIHRPVNYTHQKRLNRKQRIVNAGKLIITTPEEITGKHILIIDDIITSGATIYRIATELQPVCSNISIASIYNLK